MEEEILLTKKTCIAGTKVTYSEYTKTTAPSYIDQIKGCNGVVVGLWEDNNDGVLVDWYKEGVLKHKNHQLLFQHLAIVNDPVKDIIISLKNMEDELQKR